MSEVSRINPEEAQKLNDAVWVDTRNPQAWGEATKKIPGAIRIPADDLESHVDELPKGRPIVTYCT
jgi:rhodanese-related sulfurtransferase